MFIGIFTSSVAGHALDHNNLHSALGFPAISVYATLYHKPVSICESDFEWDGVKFCGVFPGITCERISDFFAKCGHGHQASPRRRQSHASLAEIEWRRELGHHHFNMPSDSPPAVLQFPCAFRAVIACCSCGKAGCPCPYFTRKSEIRSRIIPEKNHKNPNTVFLNKKV